VCVAGRVRVRGKKSILYKKLHKYGVIESFCSKELTLSPPNVCGVVALKNICQ